MAFKLTAVPQLQSVYAIRTQVISKVYLFRPAQSRAWCPVRNKSMVVSVIHEIQNATLEKTGRFGEWYLIQWLGFADLWFTL